MKVFERPSLKNLNTFGVEASAALRIDIESEEDILQLPTSNPSADLLLGGGSNILLTDDVPGNVLINRIPGRYIFEEQENHSLVDIGAGENWHEIVKWTLNKNLFGLENLALIPGSVGAAPMQNIGAYGVELASRVESITAWDTKQQNWRVFPREDCGFSYRDSRFKSAEPNRYIITSLRLRLDHIYSPQLEYKGLKGALQDYNLDSIKASEVFEAVKKIRTAKLPDPMKVGNAGSFFKNPVLHHENAQTLIEKYPDLPHWPADQHQTKVSAAWMIDRCGLKGYSRGPAGVSAQHALVLVNLGGASGHDIWSVASHVKSIVYQEFGIDLEPEPRIVKY